MTDTIAENTKSNLESASECASKEKSNLEEEVRVLGLKQGASNTLGTCFGIATFAGLIVYAGLDAQSPENANYALYATGVSAASMVGSYATGFAYRLRKRIKDGSKYFSDL